MYAQSVPFVLIFLTILAGILLNNKGLSDLKAELKADNAELKAELKADNAELKAELKADNAELKAELKADISRIDARLNSMQSDLNQFYVVMGKLEGRLDAIEKRAA
jgi:predicted Holliday junction resolvase-like endonuclease